MKRTMAVLLSMALAGSAIAVQAQQETAPATSKSAKKKMVAKKGPTISDQLGEMKQAIEAQQQQIKQLSDLVQTRDQKIQVLEQRLDQSQSAAVQAQARADSAVAQNAEQQQTVMALKSDVTDLKTSATNSALTLQETQKNIKDTFENPVAIHFKGVTLTPGGFLAGESYYRNRSTGGEATAFNSIFMPGSGANRISEFYGSGRQSQITLRADGNIGYAKLTGYYEADFLSAGTTSNNNQTNSYTLRQRQAWGLISFNNGWSFTGGQMWTLLTENRKGIDNLTTARPMTIDPNYNVGFSFARQYGVRLVKSLDNNRFTLAASLENPQTTFTASNAAANFALGSDGTGGGLYNPGITACTTVNNPTAGGNPLTTCTNAANYTFNAMPDIIVKAVADPGFGHYEVFGIYSRFRDRIYPCAEVSATTSNCGTTPTVSTLGVHNASSNGGGLGANARVSVLNKHMDLALHGLFGNGLGRYSASGLPDATLNPDGTLAPLRTYQGLATLEFHYPKFDIYFNAGEDYVARHYSMDTNNPTGTPVVGYGSPTYSDVGCGTETLPSLTAPSGWNFGGLSKCSGQTKDVIEATFGFWIKSYNGPKGRIQWGPQYSYVSRNAWTGVGPAGTGVAPRAVDNLFFTSFRYYLP